MTKKSLLKDKKGMSNLDDDLSAGKFNIPLTDEEKIAYDFGDRINKEPVKVKKELKENPDKFDAYFNNYLKEKKVSGNSANTILKYYEYHTEENKSLPKPPVNIEY